MAERAGDVHEDCGGRGVHLLKILIFLRRRYESLHARSGRDYSEPDHAFVSPLLLELLHVPALIMLAGVRASLIVPFQDHVLAFVIGELLRLSVIINGGEAGGRIADFYRQRGGNKKDDSGEENCNTREQPAHNSSELSSNHFSATCAINGARTR